MGDGYNPTVFFRETATGPRSSPNKIATDTHGTGSAVTETFPDGVAVLTAYNLQREQSSKTMAKNVT